MVIRAYLQKSFANLGRASLAEIIELQRGVIRYRERAKQIVDFSGLRFETITPTDIDGLIEYRNACFLFIELKHHSKPALDKGQRLALERLATGLIKPALVLHAIHSAPVTDDINAAQAVVHRYFWDGGWKIPPALVTVREVADGFFDKYGTPGR